MTPTKSPGTKTKKCPIHGDYEAEIFILFNEEQTKPCPKCLKEREEKEEKRRQEQEEEIRKAKIERWIDMCEIPKRFFEKKLSDFTANSQKQRGILKAIGNYLSAILGGSNTSLILCGKPGTGKTHLACAVLKAFIENCHSGLYITTSKMMRDVKSTYRKDSERTDEDVLSDFGDKIRLLVIDEVGVQFGTDTEKLIFYEVINRRYENMLPTVLISNLTAEELQTFIGERAFDRFKEDGGAILAFDWESHRGKN